MKRLFAYIFLLALSTIAISGVNAAVVFRTGTIYNMQGPKASAWSMKANTEKWLHESNIDKDIVNTTKITDRLPFFRRELTGANGTRFVKAKGFNIKDANYASVKKYFSKHKSAKTISGIKSGDVYLLRLRDSDDYAVLKISNIKDDGTSLLYNGNNMDYITFEYSVFKVPVSEAVAFLNNNFEEEEQPSWDPEVEMLIYPNPVLDKMHVKFRKATDNIGWVIQLENMNGEKVYSSENIYETHWVNDFKGLPEGRYVLSVLKSDKVYLQKIIDKDKPTISDGISEVYQ